MLGSLTNCRSSSQHGSIACHSMGPNLLCFGQWGLFVRRQAHMRLLRAHMGRQSVRVPSESDGHAPLCHRRHAVHRQVRAIAL